MIKKLAVTLFHLTVVGVVCLFAGCTHTKVAEHHDRDVSHNIFTGSKTVTDKNSATYRNNKTGRETTYDATKKVKYDSNGNLIEKDYDSNAR